MSADNYLLARAYKDGWLITDESASGTWGEGSNGTEGNYSDAQAAYDRWYAGSDGSWVPLWVPNIDLARQVIDNLYATSYIEYGPSFQENWT